MTLPRLYAIVDTAQAPDPVAFAEQLFAGGVRLLQLRDKREQPRRTLSIAREIRRIAPKDARLIMNDRADLCLAARFHGVHVGQDDLSVDGARRVCPQPLLIGVSTHNLEQVRAAAASDADYIAVGPVFATASKEIPDPIVGLELVSEGRKLTKKPLVAIGGITIENCRSAIDAGADSVAVISALTREPVRSTQEFMRILGR